MILNSMPGKAVQPSQGCTFQSWRGVFPWQALFILSILLCTAATKSVCGDQFLYEYHDVFQENWISQSQLFIAQAKQSDKYQFSLQIPVPSTAKAARLVNNLQRKEVLISAFLQQATYQEEAFKHVSVPQYLQKQFRQLYEHQDTTIFKRCCATRITQKRAQKQIIKYQEDQTVKVSRRLKAVSFKKDEYSKFLVDVSPVDRRTLLSQTQDYTILGCKLNEKKYYIAVFDPEFPTYGQEGTVSIKPRTDTQLQIKMKIETGNGDNQQHQRENNYIQSIHDKKKSVSNKQKGKQYLAMCTSVKQQGQYIKEWVDYHAALGVSKFYIYDDGSVPPLFTDLQPYISSGLVHYKYVMQGKPSQLLAYNDCLNENRLLHSWIMGLDVDEFVVMKSGANGTNLPKFLEQFEDYGGVAVQWKVFGSSGFLTPPEGGLLRNFVQCQTDPYKHKDGFGVKTIANTKYVNEWITAHSVKYRQQSYHTVDPETKWPQHGTTMRLIQPNGVQRELVRLNNIQLNHYTVGSQQDFDSKRQRGGGDGIVRSKEYLNRIDAQCEGKCYEGVEAGNRLLGKLQKRVI